MFAVLFLKELKMLTESVSRLKVAQQKFAESADNVERLETNKAGKIC